MRFRIAHEIPGRLRFSALDAIEDAIHVEAIERLVSSLPGVQSARYRARTGSLLVEHDGGRATRDGIVEHVRDLAPHVHPDARTRSSRAKELDRKWRELERALVRHVAGAAAGGSIRALLSVYGTIPYLRMGLASLFARRLDADLLDAAGMATALQIGDYGTAGLISLLLRIGDYMKARTEFRARSDVATTLRRDDREVSVKRDGLEERVARSELRVGDLVVVRAGSAIPVDGIARAGKAMVNQASLTGEPLPVMRRKGALVYDGTCVVEGELEIEALKVGEETRIARIARLIDEAESMKAVAQGRAIRLADRLVPYVFAVAGAAYAATGDFRRAAAVLLIDYSCALKLSIPIAIKTCVMEALKNGVVVRGGKYVEALAEVDTIIFDKTGTLTEARPNIVDIVVFGGFECAELVRDAACVEEHFPHPVASAIQREAARCGLDHRDEIHGEVKYLVAEGIISSVRGRRFVIGSKRFLRHNGVTVDEDKVEGYERSGYSSVFVGVEDALAGLFLLEDPIRREARETLAELRALGIRRMILLTGDNPTQAQRVAEVGLDEFHAEVSPEEKVRFVREARERGLRVAMVGDGINDALALATADVGISFRHGADIAREAADVLALGADLRCIPRAIRLARRGMSRVNWNFRSIVGLNSALIAAASLGGLPPALSAVLHNASTLYTSLHSMRPYNIRARAAARGDPSVSRAV